MEETKCSMFTQAHADINGREIWHYLIQTPIGNISVVEYEAPSKELVRKMFDEDYESAERYYTKTATAMVAGKK